MIQGYTWHVQQLFVRFVTLLIGNKAVVFSQCVRVKWLGDEGISPRPEHRDIIGGGLNIGNMGGPQVTTGWWFQSL